MNDTEIIELEKLFYAARRQFRIWKQPSELDPKASAEFKDYARAHELVGADALIQASALEGQGKYSEALDLLELNRIAGPIGMIATHIRGVLHHSLTRDTSLSDPISHYEQALSYYQLSLDYRSDINLPHAFYAYIDLAQCHGDLGNTEQMRLTYEQVLDLSQLRPLVDWTVPGRAWIRVAQICQGWEAKVQAFKHASEDPIEDSVYGLPASPWLYMSREYLEAGKYKEAIDAAKQMAILDIDNSSYALLTIGKAHYLNNDIPEARESFERAISLSNRLKPINRSIIHQEAREYLTIISSGLQPDDLSEEDTRALKNQTLIDTLDNEIEQRILLKIKEAEQDQYEKYIMKDDSGRNNTLSILRGWSSAVTLMEGSKSLWRGGGYLLKWQGKGIVIDPGFDFLRNFHDAGFHGREIDAVLISHNHPDHNSDVEKIDDLRYELYKRRGESELGPYSLVWDGDTQTSTQVLANQSQHRFHPILFDLGRCHPEDTISPQNNLPFSLTYFAVKHGGVRNAVGFKIVLTTETGVPFTIGYTGDTEFFPDLGVRLSGCDILLAHISQPDIDEFSNPKARKQLI